MRTASPLALFRSRPVRSFATALASFGLLTSCSEAPTGPPSMPAAVAVTLAGRPADNVVLVGGTAQLTATPVDASGATVSTTTPIAWTSSNTAVATVSGTGLVTAVSAGTTRITATYESRTAFFDLAVRAPIATPAAGATQPTVTTLFNGAVSLSIPPGAVLPGTTLNVGPAAPADIPASSELLAGTAYTFGPEGTEFARPITLTLRFDPTGMSAADLAGLAINIASRGEWVEIAGSTVGTGTVSASVSHFSTYAILRRAPATSIVIGDGNNQTAPAGTPVPVRPSVLVRDARGRAVRNTPVVFVASGGGSVSGGSATTDAGGIATVGNWTLGPSAGGNTLTATVAGLSPVTFTATATTPPIPSIALSSSSATFAYTIGGSVPASQTINVTNGGGGSLTGLSLGTINYTGGASGWLIASLAGTSAPTSIALSVSTAGLAPGSYTATVPVLSAAATNSPQTIIVTFSVAGAPPSALAVFTQPGGARTGAPLSIQPSVEVRDALGNRVTTPDVDVTATLATGNGALTGTRTVRSVGGIATFSDLSVSGTGSASITFSAPGLASATSASFAIAGPLGVSLSSVSFSATVGGAATPASSAVQVTSSGTALTGLSVGTIAYSAGASGWLSATLSGASTPATLTLSANATGIPAGTYIASVPVSESGGSSVMVTATLTVSPPPATQLAITTQPSGAESGVAFGAQPVVEIRDAGGTRVTGASNAVTATIASGSGVLSGTTTVFASNGVASFTNLRITGSGPHTIAFSSPGLTGATSGSVTITQPAPSIRLLVSGAATASVAVGANISIPITLDMSSANGANVGAVQFDVTFDATKFTFVSGTTNGSSGFSLTANETQSSTGSVTVAGFAANGVTTTQTLYTIVLQAKAGTAGSSTGVNANVTASADQNGSNVTITPRGVTVSITP